MLGRSFSESPTAGDCPRDLDDAADATTSDPNARRVSMEETS
jgi:hypothetical protein